MEDNEQYSSTTLTLHGTQRGQLVTVGPINVIEPEDDTEYAEGLWQVDNDDDWWDDEPIDEEEATPLYRTLRFVRTLLITISVCLCLALGAFVGTQSALSHTQQQTTATEKPAVVGAAVDSGVAIEGTEAREATVIAIHTSTHTAILRDTQAQLWTVSLTLLAEDITLQQQDTVILYIQEDTVAEVLLLSSSGE